MSEFDKYLIPDEMCEGCGGPIYYTSSENLVCANCDQFEYLCECERE